MKTNLIIWTILVWSTVCYSTEPKVYTEQDLEKYGAPEKNVRDKREIKSFCDIYLAEQDKCDSKDYECYSYWSHKWINCIDPPVNVRIVQ